MVHKYIRSIFLLNEAEAFSVIKPLYRAIVHGGMLLSQNFSKSQTGGCHFNKWSTPSERNRPAGYGRDFIDWVDFNTFFIEIKRISAFFKKEDTPTH
jgi:hypothetical protein